MEPRLVKSAVALVMATAVVNATNCHSLNECQEDDPAASAVSLLQTMSEVQDNHLPTSDNVSSGDVAKLQKWQNLFSLVSDRKVDGVDTGRQVDARPFANLSSVSSTILFAFIFSMVTFIGLHECLLSSKPASSKFVGFRFSDGAIMIASAAGFCDAFVVGGALIPTSYDLALSCGYGAAASGLLVSVTLVGVIPGTIAAKKWLDEESGYDQQRARSGVVLGAIISILSTILFGGVFLVLDGKALFLTLFFIRAVQGFAGGFAVIIQPIIAFRVVRQSHKKIATMCIAISQNLGLVLGPLVSALALSCRSLMVIPEKAKLVEATSAEERAMWVAFGSVMYSLTTMCLVLLVIPLELPRAEEDEDENMAKSEDVQDRSQLANLDESDKRLMYHLTNWFRVERAFVVSAIEVSTLMLLEVKYSLSVQTSSYLFSAVAVISNTVTAISLILLQKGVTSDVTMFAVSLCAVGLSAVLFFDIGGMLTLMVADFLVYGFSTTCYGIVEFWGMTVADNLDGFTMARWRVVGAMGITVMRLGAPPVARVLIETGSRNSYAAVQAVIVTCGLLTGAKLHGIRCRSQQIHCPP
eukprot:TRINITY_DN11595_c0_g1_i1.p1 TRINITY_DN11595_c0_g1~~TRINITY_DN11595_c0_g1_i1.p1  ORF type:complete len:583 (+),score=42.98 TRINITY_DN11595_c0_g1_i1:57-1805(+)